MHSSEPAGDSPGPGAPTGRPPDDRRRAGGRYAAFIAHRFVRSRRAGFVSLISLLSALGFLVGVMSLIIALSLMTGFQQDVISRILDSNAHILVQPADGAATIADPPALARRLEEIPGVAAAGPVVHGFAGIVGPSGLLQWTAVTGAAAGTGERVTGIGRRMTQGQLNALSGPTTSGRPGIILGQELSRRVGVVPGEAVRLLIPRPRLTPWGASVQQRTFEVVGLFATGFHEYDVSWSLVALPVGQELFDAPGGAHWIAVRVRDVRRLAEIEGRIAESLGSAYAVDDVLRRNRPFFSALRLEKLLMFLAVGLIVLVAALGIVSTLVLTVAQKVREIGVLVALGATPRGVLNIFVLQGLAMGLAGTALGATLGVALAVALDRFRIIRLDPEIYYLDHLPFSVQPFDLLLIVGIAVVVALVATVHPAWRAARLDPVEALRRD